MPCKLKKEISACKEDFRFLFEAVIELRGEEYVKEVFAEDYEDYRINVLVGDNDEDKD